MSRPLVKHWPKVAHSLPRRWSVGRCMRYLSGLAQHVWEDFWRFYPARTDEDMAALGFGARQWYEPYYRTEQGTLAPKTKLTAAEAKMRELGWTFSPLYPHAFSGTMRKVAQKLAGTGRLAAYGLSPLWDQTHGLLSGPLDEQRLREGWGRRHYDRDYWIIEVGRAGVYAQPVRMCNEARHAGLSADAYLALEEAAQARYGYLPLGGGFERALTLPVTGLDEVYGRQALFPEYGWAFNEAGTEAQIIVWDWTGDGNYVVFYRYKLTLSTDADGAPTSASVGLEESGYYWYVGFGGLNVPNHVCGYLVTFPGNRKQNDDLQAASPSAADFSCPVAVYYNGDEEVVYRYHWKAPTVVDEIRGMLPGNGANGAYELDESNPAPPNFPGQGPWFSHEEFFATQIRLAATESGHCFSSPVTLEEQYDILYDFYRRYFADSGPSFNAREPDPWYANPTELDFCIDGPSAGYTSIITVNGEQHYERRNAISYSIGWRTLQDSNGQRYITDTLAFAWWDREALFHYRQDRNNYGARTDIHYGQNGPRGTWEHGLLPLSKAGTEEERCANTFVVTTYNNFLGTHTVGTPVDGKRIVAPDSPGVNDWFIIINDGYEGIESFVLGTAQKNTLFERTSTDVWDPAPENVYTSEHTCLDGLLLAAMQSAYEQDAFLCSKNAFLQITGQGVDYGFGALSIDPSTRASPLNTNHLNVFAAVFMGDDVEAAKP